MEDVNPKVEAFLKFIDGQVREDVFVHKLEQAVEEAKSNKKWRMEYMTLDRKLREEFEDGRELGLEQGLEQGAKTLAETLLEFGVSREDIVARLIRKYGMTEEKALKYLDCAQSKS